MNSMLGMAGIGSIGIFWNQFVGLFARIRALVIVSVELPNSSEAAAVLYYLKSTMKEIDIGDRRYSWRNIFVRSLDRYACVPYEIMGKLLIFRKGWRPIVMTMNTDKDGNNLGSRVTFIRGTFYFKDIYVNAVLLWDNRIHIREGDFSIRFGIRKFFGRNPKGGDSPSSQATHAQDPSSRSKGDLESTPLHYSRDDLGMRMENKPFDRLAYSESVQQFEKEVRRWKKSEKWFKARGLPWRFGGGLFGPAGTGKTSYVRAIAQDLDMPIHSYDLTAMSNEELVGFWDESVNSAPCIVLFEDMDRIFDQDKMIKGVEGKAPLTMDCLLNCIGGVQSADGILVLVTANDVSKLDSALGVPDSTGKSTRPGRLDRAVWFGELEEKGRVQIAKRILAGYEELIEQAVADGVGETGAQFESRCCKLALERYWNDQTVGIS